MLLDSPSATHDAPNDGAATAASRCRPSCRAYRYCSDDCELVGSSIRQKARTDACHARLTVDAAERGVLGQPTTDAPPEPVTFVTTDGDVVETLCRCANIACRKGFVPKSKLHKHCSAACREVCRAQTPARKAGNVRRSARSYLRDGRAYRAVRRWLLTTGQLTPAMDVAVRTLRGQTKLTADEGRALLGLPPVGRKTPRPAPEAPPHDARDPWALPSPTADCVGYTLALDIRPRPHPALTLASTRLLHGALSHALREDHAPDGVAHFALVPVEGGIGWQPLFFVRARAERLRDTAHPMTLPDGARPTRRRRKGPETLHRTLAFGPLVWRVRAPVALPAGRYRVTIETLTPLCFTTCRHRTSVRTPQVSTFVGGLRRVADAVGVTACASDLAFGAITHATEPVRVEVGGHVHRGTHERGVLLAIEGTLTVECNAVAAWLLQCAERGGLGGSTAFGFGRVRVSVAPATAAVETVSRSVATLPFSALRSPRLKESLG